MIYNAICFILANFMVRGACEGTEIRCSYEGFNPKSPRVDYLWTISAAGQILAIVHIGKLHKIQFYSYINLDYMNVYLYNRWVTGSVRRENYILSILLG